MKHLLSITKTGMLIAFFVLIYTLHVSAQFTTSSVMGRAKGLGGEYLVGYQIIVKNTGGQEFKVKTNKNGKFRLMGMRKGQYTVSIWDPKGKKLSTQNATLIAGDKVINFDLALDKTEREADPAFIAAQKARAEEKLKSKNEFTSLKDYFESGNYLLGQKRYDEAITQFEGALKVAKLRNLPVILARIADTHTAAENYPEAEKTYKQALELRPEAAGVHGNFGVALAKMGKIDEAQLALQKASELDPGGAAKNYFNLGAILYNQGTDMDAATDAFKKCLASNPEYADAHFLTAQAMMGKVTLDPETGSPTPPEGLVESLRSYLKLEPAGKYSNTAKLLIQTMTGKVQTTFKASRRKKKGKK